MVREFDVELSDGYTLHAYDTGDADDQRLAVVWHHGTPNIGSPPAPLFAAADRLGLRWVSYDRPGYGGSTRQSDRDVATAARFTASVADALDIERFAVMGHSGGAPHALACGARLPDRVVAVVGVAALAPFDANDLDWFAGMIPSGVAALSAAAEGRDAKERFEASGVEYDPEFTAADLAAFAADWSWFGSVVGPAVAAPGGGAVDDDLAYVAPWGFAPDDVVPPTLLLHGVDDGIAPCAHSAWLARRCPHAELRTSPGDGHISVLNHAADALEWLHAQR